MDIGRIIAREMSKTKGVRVLNGIIKGRVTPDVEWIKWLSY